MSRDSLHEHFRKFIRNSICLLVCCVYGLSTDGWAEDDDAWNVRFVEIARHKQKSESANALKFKLALPKCRVRDDKNVLISFHRVMMPDCSTLFVSFNSFASGWYFNSSTTIYETRCWAQISLLTAFEKVQRRLLTRIQSCYTFYLTENYTENYDASTQLAEKRVSFPGEVWINLIFI